MSRFLLFMLLALNALPGGAFACGEQSDCVLGTRTYRIHMPSDARAGKIGALIFAHGYRGSAAAEMGNARLLRLADDLGVALIAPKSAGDDWAIAGAPSHSVPSDKGELAYFDALLGDITARFNIDPDHIVAAGFSAGGMMVWTLACHRGSRFSGFIAFSGTFWAPVPETCDSPAANLVHIHGTRDTTVPLAGRPIGDARQGDVPAALAMYARRGDFGPKQAKQIGNLSCQLSRNDAGQILDFCTFDGGHSFDTDHLRAAWGLLHTAR